MCCAGFSCYECWRSLSLSIISIIPYSNCPYGLKAEALFDLKVPCLPRESQNSSAQFGSVPKASSSVLQACPESLKLKAIQSRELQASSRLQKCFNSLIYLLIVNPACFIFSSVQSRKLQISSVPQASVAQFSPSSFGPASFSSAHSRRLQFPPASLSSLLQGLLTKSRPATQNTQQSPDWLLPGKIK